MDIKIPKTTSYLSILFIILLSACQTSKTTLIQSPISSNNNSENLLDSGSRPISYRPHIPVWVKPNRIYHAARTQKHDLIHTQLAIDFDWAARQVYGLATLTLQPYFYPQDSIELDAKGFKIFSVNLKKDTQNLSLKYVYNGSKLKIALDKQYQRNESYQLEIDYVASPEKLKEQGIEQGLYFINPDGKEANKPQQIWTQGETEHNSAWFPTIDAPNERCTQEMYITVDKKFVTLSNGELIYSIENEDNTRTDYWKMDQAHAPYLFMLAVGEFSIVQDAWQDKEVSYYVEPAYAPYAKAIFGKTPKMIQFFSEKLNYPFPWNKYAQVVVRDFVSGAMENTTASVFMEALQVDSRTLLDDHWESIIAHELFHQWFGDLVTCESWANLPLNEAFANYSEYLWAEYEYGREQADYLGHIELLEYLEEAEEKQEPLIRYYYRDQDDMFDAHSYNKGGRVLHMLRYYVGDEAFWEALHLYLKKHAFTSVEIDQLRQAFETLTGEDLHWFFDQWFLSPGHPQLEVSHSYQAGKLTLQVKQTQDSLYNPIYQLPLQVAIWVNGQKNVYDIKIKQASETFSFPIRDEPKLVVFDEEQQLLATINHSKSREEWAFQYYHADKYLARYEALNQLSIIDSMGSELSTGIYFAAMDDPFWAIRDMALHYFFNRPQFVNRRMMYRIQEMAQSDPKSYVRAAAIDLLNELDTGNDFEEIYQMGLQDSAYTVLAASLYALSQHQNKTQNLNRMAAYEKLTDPSVTQVLAEYYTNILALDKFDWIQERVLTQKGLRQYQMIQFVGKFIPELPGSQQEKGLALLAQIASEDFPQLSKLAAFQTLSLLDTLPGVSEMLQNIKNQEKDPELLEVYRMFSE